LGLIALCEAGSFDLVVSAAHEIENAQNPHLDRRSHALSVLSMARYRAAITPEARQLAAVYTDAGLHGLDALHLAAAVSSECDLFGTTDDRLLRRAQTLDTSPTVVGSPLDLSLHLP